MVAAALWRTWSPENWSKHVHHAEDAVRSRYAAAGLRLDRAFRFGDPFLQIGPFERGNPVAGRILGLGQRFLSKRSLVLRYVNWWNRLLNKERGFVATKISRGIIHERTGRGSDGEVNSSLVRVRVRPVAYFDRAAEAVEEVGAAGIRIVGALRHVSLTTTCGRRAPRSRSSQVAGRPRRRTRARRHPRPG